MGSTSPDLLTGPFKSGMPGLVLQLASHTNTVQSIAYFPAGRHIFSGPLDSAIHLWDLSPHDSIQLSSCSPMHPDFCVEPDPDG